MSDLINRLRHMADHHRCCEGTILKAVDSFGQLERENAALREKVRQLKMDLHISRQRGCREIVETEKLEIEIEELRQDRERLYALLAKYEREEGKG